MRRLQSLLNQAGYNAGPVDGIYGPKTEDGVSRLQSTTADVSNSGTYDEATRVPLARVL